jgi:hypothetical protein
MIEHNVSFRRQWGWPLALTLLTVIGLISALIGEGGVWWLLSWIALSMPLLVPLRHMLVRRKAPTPSTPSLRRDYRAPGSRWKSLVATLSIYGVAAGVLLVSFSATLSGHHRRPL